MKSYQNLWFCQALRLPNLANRWHALRNLPKQGLFSKHGLVWIISQLFSLLLINPKPSFFRIFSKRGLVWIVVLITITFFFGCSSPTNSQSLPTFVEKEIYQNPFNPIESATECSALPLWSKRIGKISIKEANWVKQNSDSLPYSLHTKRSVSLHPEVCKEFKMLIGSTNDSLQRILQKIQKVVSQEVVNAPTYTAFLIEKQSNQPVFNAYSTGSYVYIGQAMFRLAKTESQKASLICHEIAHSLLHHSTSGIRRRQVARQIVGDELSDAFTRLYNNIKPLNQIHELTTDFVACYLLYKAGYTSDAGAELFDYLDSIKGQTTKFQQFFSSHPDSELRANCIREYCSNARKRAKKEAFLRTLRKVTLSNE